MSRGGVFFMALSRCRGVTEPYYAVVGVRRRRVAADSLKRTQTNVQTSEPLCEITAALSCYAAVTPSSGDTHTHLRV